MGHRAWIPTASFIFVAFYLFYFYFYNMACFSLSVMQTFYFDELYVVEAFHIGKGIFWIALTYRWYGYSECKWTIFLSLSLLSFLLTIEGTSYLPEITLYITGKHCI